MGICYLPGCWDSPPHMVVSLKSSRRRMPDPPVLSEPNNVSLAGSRHEPCFQTVQVWDQRRASGVVVSTRPWPYQYLSVMLLTARAHRILYDKITPSTGVWTVTYALQHADAAVDVPTRLHPHHNIDVYGFSAVPRQSLISRFLMLCSRTVLSSTQTTYSPPPPM